jgi:hypothetical protein
MIARLFQREGDLALGPGLKVAQERVAHRGGIKTGRREAVKQDVALLELGQPVFPSLRDRAFLRQQGPRAELEGNGAQLRVVDPVVPVRRYQTPPAITIGTSSEMPPSRIVSRRALTRG